jgi:hypothetical protein
VSGDKITIKYGSRDISNLGKLSGRIINTGNAPIERRDIEEPVSLTFSAGEILEFYVTETAPEGISASAVHKGRVVNIVHGLLNPGDWIGYEVLVDGPADWPEASFRISGIKEPAVTYPSNSPRVDTVTGVPLPMVYQGIAVTITLLVAIGLWVLVVFGLTLGIEPAVKARRQLRSTAFRLLISKDRGGLTDLDSRLVEDLDSRLAESVPGDIVRKLQFALRSFERDPSWTGEVFSKKVEAKADAISKEVQVTFLNRISMVDWGALKFVFVALVAAIATTLVGSGSLILLFGRGLV